MFSKIKSKDKASKLREKLNAKSVIVMPGCFDSLSAKLIEKEGLDVGFMSGFCVSSTRLGMPDTGLISFSEMVDQVRNICNSTSIPIIFDGDTGYGNSVNVFRTVRGYADAGAAGVMIEDQKWPKKCGHTKGKDVVDLDEAKSRIKAAVDARNYGGNDILIMARTDAIATRGLDDAINRMKIFSEIGADILFIEAVKSKDDMKRIIKEVPGHHMINLIEDGDTPLLEINEIEQIGYKIAVMPLTLMSASVKIMQECLKNMKNRVYNTNVSKFSELRDIVGFNEYYEIEDKYK
jgi:2-methylisocitrate lyase-like PEP mutase family enzyme